MRVGRISFVNTRPFFHSWPSDVHELIPGTPRQLAEAAKMGEIDAGLLPVTSCWDLQDEFEPLGNFGIAVREQSRSVFLLSRMPLEELAGATVGMTNDSNASVRLLHVLLSQKYGLNTNFKRGFSDDDDAWLVIGDQALGYWRSSSPSSHRTPSWKYVIDLATEWWAWQKRPFVFAQWVVRRSISNEDKMRLSLTVAQNLDKGLASLRDISKETTSAGLTPEDVETYLRGFRYRFSSDEEASLHHFRLLVEKLDLSSEVSR